MLYNLPIVKVPKADFLLRGHVDLSLAMPHRGGEHGAGVNSPDQLPQGGGVHEHPVSGGDSPEATTTCLLSGVTDTSLPIRSKPPTVHMFNLVSDSESSSEILTLTGSLSLTFFLVFRYSYPVL